MKRTLVVLLISVGLATVVQGAFANIENEGRSLLNEYSDYQDSLDELSSKLREYKVPKKIDVKRVLTLTPILSEYMVSLEGYRNTVCKIEASIYMEILCVNLQSEKVVFAAKSEGILDKSLEISVDRLK